MHQLAHSRLHSADWQESLPRGRGQVRDGGAEGSSAVGGGGQDGNLTTPDVDSMGLPVDSMLSILLKKMIQWCLSNNPFFLIIDDSSTGWHSEWLLQHLCIVLCWGPAPQRLPGPLQVKKIPLPLPAVNFSGSSGTSSSWCSSAFCWAYDSIRPSLVSSLCCMAEFNEVIPYRYTTSFLLRVTKLLKISLNSMPIF